jgi:ribosomal protein S21
MNKNQKHHQSITPGVGVKVVSTKRFPKGDIEFALRKFKKEIKSSGKMQQLKDNRYFTPKSETKRKQVERARYFQQLDSKNLLSS